MSILARLACASTAASGHYEWAFTWETERGVKDAGVDDSAGLCEVCCCGGGKVRWDALGGCTLRVLEEALFAVGAEVLERGVLLEVAFDRAERDAIGGRHPRVGEVVGGGAFLALLVKEADAVREALAWLWGGGAKGVADVEVFGLGAADLADVVLFFFKLARADAHHEGFVFPPEFAALADDVIDRSKDVLEFKEELARPIEAERRAHHGDDVKVPDELFSGGGDEPVGGVDLSLLAIAFEQLEARASARLVEVGEADPIGNGLVVYFDHKVGRGVGKSARKGAHVGLVVGGAAFFGFKLPVGDREFDWDFREGEEDVFAVLGFELLRAIG
eukprot:scaffold5888_cov118-Isochrysis_galbana.AAC.7